MSTVIDLYEYVHMYQFFAKWPLVVQQVVKSFLKNHNQWISGVMKKSASKKG